jgi:hypothetical protein
MAMTTKVVQPKPGGDVLNKLALGLHLDAGVAAQGHGATAARPTGLTTDDIGYFYFDTTLGLPVFWTGAAWHNAAGSVA